MKITNKLGLPEPLVLAVANDPYDKGDCDFSATELIAPPHLKTLAREHKDEIEVDASDRIWALWGQAVHGVLERSTNPEYILERRFVGVFDIGGVKVRVGAKIDVLHVPSMTLEDYKATSVYKFKADYTGQIPVPPEYAAQLNIQVECIQQEIDRLSVDTLDGIAPLSDWDHMLSRLQVGGVKTARIVGILRDWRKAEAMREQGYPEHNVGIMPVPIWPREERIAYIKERVRLHMLPTPPACTPEETWERPSKYALMMDGQKRAVRLYDSKQEAENAALQCNTSGRAPAKYYTEPRPGGRTRCAGYCEVSKFCKPYQEYLKGASV